MGNSRARAVYEAQLPDGFRRPQTDNALESFIRAKYEHKKYIAREWVPPSPPKVDWNREIDEELEKQKKKKKSGGGIGLVGSLNSSLDKKPLTSSTTSNVKSSPLPAPLPKPKSSVTSSPKNTGSGSMDLLGLTSPVSQPTQPASNESFTGFLSNPTNGASNGQTQDNSNKHANGGAGGDDTLSLAKEEEDFFKQTTSLPSDGGGIGKMSKDSILALYGSAPSGMQFNSNPMSSTFPQQTGNSGWGQPQPQPPHHAQFMQPPQSATIYNAPVMTAPAAFSHPQMMMGMQQSTGGFAQFPSMQSFQQQPPIMSTNAFSGQTMSGGFANPMNQQKPPNGATGNNALNQQFGNLNIGNVWQ